MSGEGYFIVQRDSKTLAGYATHTGGETLAKSIDVASDSRPATMVAVPSGALEYVPLELEFEDRAGDGFYIDDFLLEMNKWNIERGPDGNGIRSSINVICYSGPALEKDQIAYILSLNKAWCSKVEMPKGDRSSDAPRRVKVTIVHMGSTVTRGGEQPTTQKEGRQSTTSKGF